MNMRKLLILICLLPLFAQAQNTNGTLQRQISSPNAITGVFGATRDSLYTRAETRALIALPSGNYIQNQKATDQNASIRISESIAVGERNIITSNLTVYADSVYNGAAFGPDNRLYSWFNLAAGTGNFLDGKITGAVGNTNIGSANDSFVSGNRNVIGRVMFPVLSQGVDDPGLGTGNKAYVIIDVAEGDISAHFPNSQLDGNTAYINANYETGYTISGGYVSNPAVPGDTWRMPPYMILRSATNEIDISLRKILKADYSGSGTKIYYDTTASVYPTISYVYGSYSPVVKVKGVFGGNGLHGSGLFSSARGYGADASGSFTRAWNNYAKASNYYTRATGVASSSFGYETDANTYAHLVGGRWNIGGGTTDSWVTGDPLFELGNGTSSAARSNAFRVLKNGNTKVYGTFESLGNATLGGTLDVTGTITGTLNGTATNVSGVVAIANGGTGQTTAPLARTALGGTTVGQNFFTLTNPSAITFPRINADNTVTARTASEIRSDIGAGTVTSVSVVTANGVSGSVATSTTTPAITVTLGAITPSSVASTGNVSITQSVNDASAYNNTNSSSGTLASSRFNATNDVGTNLQHTTYSSGFTPSVFGAPRSNWSALLSSGASSNGMLLGTFTPDPVIIGTNDIPAITVSSVQIADFVNSPTVPTPSANDNSTKVASTAYVDAQAGGAIYTATATAGTLVSSVGPGYQIYSRSRNTVTIHGYASVTTSGAGAADFYLSIPVASDFTASPQMFGTGSGVTPNFYGVGAEADPTGDRAKITFISTGSTPASITYTYQYIIL